MIRRVVVVQLVAFVVLSLLVAGYLAIAILRLPILDRPYEVTMRVADTGGLFERSQVTYRGVEVGSVTRLELLPEQVIEVTMALDPDVDIPDDLVVDVSAFSAVGEQYVNLEPRRREGPFLSDGDVIATSDVALPPKPSTVLAAADRFLSTLDVRALTSVVDELGATFDGLGPVLQQALDRTQRVTGTLQRVLPQTRGVIRDGGTVLDGQLGELGSIRSFSRDLSDLSQQLVSSDGDLRRLIGTGTEVSSELAALLDDPTRSALAVLLGNLVSTNEILAVRTPALRQLAVVLPDSLLALTRTIGSGDALPLDLQFQDGDRCDYGTPEVPQERTAVGDPPAPFLDRTCADPSQLGERSASRAPRAPGSTTPSGGDRQVKPLARGAARTPTGSYDPVTGLANEPGGAPFSLGPAGSYGEASWTTLLLAGLTAR